MTSRLVTPNWGFRDKVAAENHREMPGTDIYTFSFQCFPSEFMLFFSLGSSWLTIHFDFILLSAFEEKNVKALLNPSFILRYASQDDHNNDYHDHHLKLAHNQQNIIIMIFI